MPDCPFQISGPQKLGKAATATYQLSPTPDGALCSVQWSINGQPLKAQNTYADLFISQVGFNEIIVKATSDDPAVNITATITCRGDKPCGPTPIPFVVGTPMPDNSRPPPR